MGRFLHIQRFDKPLYDLHDYYAEKVRPYGLKLLSNGEGFLQFGKGVKIKNGISFLQLYDAIACPEISKGIQIHSYSGEFSSIIMERSGKQTNLSRDVFGAKNLYFYFHNNLLLAASEIPILLAVLEKIPPINKNTVSRYFDDSFGSNAISSETFFTHIYRVLPGQSLLINTKKVQPVSYWQPETLPLDAYAQPHIFFKDAFIASVKNRTKGLDRTACSLSGGLDSSSIVSTQSQLKTGKVQSIYFQTSTQKADEEHWSKLVAESAGSQHTTVYLGKNPLYDCEKVVELTGEPDPMAIPAVIFLPIFSECQKEKIPVLLSGHGGDNILEYGRGHLTEILLQADFHEFLREFSNYCNIQDKPYTSSLSQFLLWNLRKHPLKIMSFVFQGTIQARHVASRLKEFFIPKTGFLRLPKAKKQQSIQVLYPKIENKRILSLLENTLSELSILSMESIQSMSNAHSLVTTYPFLSKEILEISAAIPQRVNYYQGKERGILKKSMEGMVPQAVLERTDKASFNSFCTDFLEKLFPQVKNRWPENHLLWRHVNPSAFYTLAEELHRGKTFESARKLYKIISFGLWLDRYYS